MSTDLTQADWSRQHGVRPGDDMHDAILIDGFDQQSIWGYDSGTGSFFAQIWQNGSRSDHPDLWLTAPTWTLSCAQAVVAPLVDHTAADPLDVVRGLGIAHPSPSIAPANRIFDQFARIADSGDNDFTAGAHAATRWMLGDGDKAPLSQTRSLDPDATPAPEDIDAESSYATSVVYLTRSDYAIGAETMLVFALSITE